MKTHSFVTVVSMVLALSACTSQEKGRNPPGQTTAGTSTGTTTGGTTAGTTTGGTTAGTTTGGTTAGTTTGGTTAGTTTGGTTAGTTTGGTTAGTTTGGTTAASTSTGTTTGGTTGAASWPIVPNPDGAVVTAPNIVLLTSTKDSNTTVLKAFTSWLATGGYLNSVGTDYGVGNGTAQAVSLDLKTYPAPTNTLNDDSAFPNYLQTLLTAGAIPAAAASNIYVLVLPSTWSDTNSFCQSYGGYHEYFTDGDGNSDLYAIIPNCYASMSVADQLQQIEVAISHEVVEAATDPFVSSFQIQDPTNPWTYLGGEVADLCAGATTYFTNGTYYAQLIWSNSAVQAGQVPCQPWSATQNYDSLTGPTMMVSGAAGTQVQIPITGWSSKPSTTAMTLATEDGDYLVDFTTTPTLSADSVTPGASVNVILTIPATATSGQHGAAWVVATDSVSGVSEGSVMVGVTVQ